MLHRASWNCIDRVLKSNSITHHYTPSLNYGLYQIPTTVLEGVTHKVNFSLNAEAGHRKTGRGERCPPLCQWTCFLRNTTSRTDEDASLSSSGERVRVYG